MLELERKGFVISGMAGLLTGLLVAVAVWSETPPPRETVAAAPIAVAPGPASSGAPQPAEAQPGIDTSNDALPSELLNLKAAAEIDGRMVQDLGGGRMVEYTVVPALQKRATQVLEQAEVPFGAMVALEPRTGRVLGYVEHSTAMPNLEGLARRANPPAASVFKVVTTAALLEHARIAPDYEVCFNGGRRGISARHLEDDPKRDTRCHSLNEALARSTNAIFGKLADRHLDAQTMDDYARAFGWGRDIPFVLPVEPSAARFSDERVTFARTAAGFYNTQLSPLHAAMVASTIANGGVMMEPKLVERYVAWGEPRLTRDATPMGRAIRERTAKVMADMMVATTELGTARKYFSKRARSLKGIHVAAKTGSLSARALDGERHHFSWWIGFAPAENPTIAVAALVVNVGAWRIKSTYLAREVLETWFAEQQKADVSSR